MSQRPSVAAIASLLGPIELPEDEHESFVASLWQRQSQAIRVHEGVEPNSLPFQLQPVPWSARGYWPSTTQQPSRSLHYATADYYIQDAGSLLALAGIETSSDLRVCDLCAAPGGKASAIAEALGNSGWLVANEPIQSRLAPLIYNLARSRSNRWVVTSQDPARLATRCAGMFDVVLIDAPCSGQALLGRGRQRNAALSVKQIEHSAARQQRIFDAAVDLLAPRGTLVYSTCTFAFLENEAHCGWLCEQYPQMTAMPIDQLREYQTSPGCYRLWPHRHHCGGAFMMRLSNRDEDTSLPQRARRLESRLQQRDPPPEWAAWGELSDQRCFSDSSRCFAWPDDIPEPFVSVSAAGPEMAHLVGATWQPSHALALRQAPNWTPAQTVDLSADQARAFARGETVQTDQQGWTIARWNGRSLGWGKGSQGILKNQLPKYARLPLSNHDQH